MAMRFGRLSVVTIAPLAMEGSIVGCFRGLVVQVRIHRGPWQNSVHSFTLLRLCFHAVGSVGSTCHGRNASEEVGNTAADDAGATWSG